MFSVVFHPARADVPMIVNMDSLVSGVVALKQAQIASRVQIAVARKILESDKMQGAAALKLLEAAAGGVNKSGDALVAAATGLGGVLDTYA